MFLHSSAAHCKVSPNFMDEKNSLKLSNVTDLRCISSDVLHVFLLNSAPCAWLLSNFWVVRDSAVTSAVWMSDFNIKSTRSSEYSPLCVYVWQRV